MNATRRAVAAVAAAAFAIGGATLPGGSAAAAGRSVRNLKGEYTLAWYGDNAALAAPNTQFALNASLYADGKGLITGGSLFYNDGGTICAGNIAASVPSIYSIRRDGEGEFNLSFTPTAGFSCPVTHFEFPIAISGLRPSGIATRASIGAGGGLVPTLSGSGLAFRQSRRGLLPILANLASHYSFSWFGHDFLTYTGPPNAFAASGEIAFDPLSGAITGGSITYNDGGALCTGSGLAGTAGPFNGSLGGSLDSINLDIPSPLGSCPLTSFILVTALSDYGSNHKAGRIQFISDHAAPPSGGGSSDVVLSGLAVQRWENR